MIQPNELRIGNRYNVLGQHRELMGVSKLNGTKETALHYAEFKGIIPLKLVHLRPIAPTPELMQEAGFELTYQGWERNIGSGWSKMTVDAEDYSFSVDSTVDDHEVCLDNDIIDSIHRLQNIWFSLSGEELFNQEEQ